MTSSTVASTVFFLFVLLVFPNIDMVFGAQIEHRKLKEANHADLVTVQKFPNFGGLIKPKPGPNVRFPKIRRCPSFVCPPPPPYRFSKGTDGSGH